MSDHTWRSYGAPSGLPRTRLRDSKLTHSPGNLEEFQRMAIGLEDAGVALYNGQAANVTPKTLAAAAEIVSVEARHAAWARDLAGEIPAPVPTDVAADAEQIKRQLTRLGVRVA